MDEIENVELTEPKSVTKLKSILNKRNFVLRITVDDIISTDITRFEICKLKPKIKEFLYDLDIWETGFELIGYIEEFDHVYNILLPWYELSSGQVYYYGSFEVIGEDKSNPENFRFKKGNRELKRIDEHEKYRDGLRRLYSNLLTRRASDA